jgi:hypothetical protein
LELLDTAKHVQAEPNCPVCSVEALHRKPDLVVGRALVMGVRRELHAEMAVGIGSVSIVRKKRYKSIINFFPLFSFFSSS